MDARAKRGGSRRRTNVRVAFVLALILAGVVGLGYWDRHRYDAKVPLGTWFGTFAAPTGTRGAMLVVVKRRLLHPQETYMGKSNGVYFVGAAQLCFPAQPRQSFRLDGFTDQSGPGFTFYLVPARHTAAGLGFSADGLHGARRGVTLTMSGHLISFGRPGEGSPTSDPLRQTLVVLAKGKGQRLADTCRALKAPRK